jgi:polyhydroxyalkanoate synthesis regulator phasin
VNGRPLRFYTFPGTPSDHRAEQNTRAGVRRLLREDGVITRTEAKPKSPDRLTQLEQRVTALEQRLAELIRS